jgi:hypothetical protein
MSVNSTVQIINFPLVNVRTCRSNRSISEYEICTSKCGLNKALARCHGASLFFPFFITSNETIICCVVDLSMTETCAVLMPIWASSAQMWVTFSSYRPDDDWSWQFKPARIWNLGKWFTLNSKFIQIPVLIVWLCVSAWISVELSGTSLFNLYYTSFFNPRWAYCLPFPWSSIAGSLEWFELTSNTFTWCQMSRMLVAHSPCVIVELHR